MRGLDLAPRPGLVPYRFRVRDSRVIRHGAIVWANPEREWDWRRGCKNLPWVSGKDCMGGMYSPHARRFIPFHKEDQWYQFGLHPYDLLPFVPKGRARGIAL